jgi:uncharacterized protein (DUF58 family)
VVLDVRRGAHDHDTLETAVSAAASIVTTNGARRDLVRLVTTDGTDSGFGSGTTHVQSLLEHLAVVQATGSASLRAMLDMVQRDGQGALVLVVGRTSGDDLSATTRLRQRYGLVVVVWADAAGPDRQPAAPAAPAATVIRVAAGAPFPAAWNRVVGVTPHGRVATGPGAGGTR